MAKAAHQSGVLSGTLNSHLQTKTQQWCGLSPDGPRLSLDPQPHRVAPLATSGALICLRLCPDSSPWPWTELCSLTKLTVSQPCAVVPKGNREKMEVLSIIYPTVGM